MRLIDADALIEERKEEMWQDHCDHMVVRVTNIENAPTVDAVKVVRCQNCIHAEPLDHNCELSTKHYLHCRLWRGEETKNVWHKYKKYYKDYSLVERDGYCDSGAKMDGKDDVEL